MSSPCKKIKLTPKRHKADSLRQTQESKITSTPQRSQEDIVSPNISRISSSTSNKIIRTRLLEQFSSNSSEITSSITYNSKPIEKTKSTRSSIYKSSSEKSIGSNYDYDHYLDDCGRIKYTGNIWKIYKPLNDESLYARIFREPQSVQEVVTELLLLYNRKPEIALCSLLKLCVDLCGYQNFNISENYNFRENAARHIIKMMESDDVIDKEALKSTGKYLFMESKTQLANILKVSIYNFLQKLILCGHERGILYDEFFLKHFFLFIKAMSFSEIRAIRHTGVIIAIKVLTALVMVYNKIINDDNYSSDMINSSTENVLHLQKQDVIMFLEIFYFIFVQNCRLQDNKVTLMRVECIRELCTWIKYFPKIFITQLQAVSYLCKLITDASKDVRYAALETFEALVQAPSVLTILRSFMPDFVEAVGKRFYDVDNKVAIKAIDIFTVFLKQDESLITTHRFKLLTNLVFDKSFVIGESAARFLSCYLNVSEENEHTILIQLAKLSMKPGYAVKQLLIEGCLHNCTAIQNWEAFIDLLEYDNVEMDIKQALAEIFSESVYQTLEGHSSIMREMSPKVTNINPTEYTKIAKYCPRLNSLLKKYKDHPSILLEFLKILCSVTKDILNENYCQQYMEICQTMIMLFYYHNEEKLLNQLAETFHQFCNITHFAKRAETITENVCSKYANDLLLSLKNNEENSEKLMKVSILFAHFNLTKYFTWEALFDNWGHDDETATGNLISCCEWFLIWSLRNLTSTNYPVKSELQKQFPQISRICKEFISTCFNMLQHLNGRLLHFKIYNAVCHLHITFMKDLEGPIKMFKQFEELKLIIDDRQLQRLLVSFLDKYVISNTTMLLHDRRNYVVNYVDLVHNNALPTECLAHIFKYYYSYNKEFGPIIESSLMAMSSDENILFMMVVYTLTIVYENILSKYGTVNLRTEEIRQIKLLLKQFLTFKVFRSPNRSFKKLLYFAFNYSFKDESNYSFLYFVKHFVELLIDEDRKEVFDFFKNKIPNGMEKNDAVLYIANYMKTFKTMAKRGGLKTLAKENKPTKNSNNSLKRQQKVPNRKATNNTKKNTNRAEY